MKAFADLYRALDESNRTNDKVAAIVAYLERAAPEDAAWAIHFLIGKRPKRPVNTTKLATWAREEAGLPEWLWDESYHAIGDLAETLAILVPGRSEEEGGADRPLHTVVRDYVLGLAGRAEEEQRDKIAAIWRESTPTERLVFNKLITGAFRVGVNQELVIRAAAKVSGRPKNVIAHRMMGNTIPSAAWVEALYAEEGEGSAVDASQPYPFCLAYPLEIAPEELGPREDWRAEWKWDGIRAQIIKRQGKVAIWSRGEDLITERFPELAALGERLPDGTVLDGECLAWSGGKPLRFGELQRRIGRKELGPKILREVPVALVAFDLLEWEGRDLRDLPMSERRGLLGALPDQLTGAPLIPDSPAMPPPGELGLIEIEPRLLLVEGVPGSWDELAALRSKSRELNTEGLMLKRWNSRYETGRKKGGWFKWKIEPMTVDAVMVYAQPGNGIRASLYSDYTFAVWDAPPTEGGKLVPFAKAYSGLTDAELRRVDAWIRKNTLEKFGPVRSVKAERVFELAFEGIALSTRHKSGVAVRFPRILREREDKGPEDADSLETIKAMIRAEEANASEAA